CIIFTDVERTHALIPCGHKIPCDCLNLLYSKCCTVCSEYFNDFLRI
ncbi:putative inhibitor of apoptosis, partial [Aphis craccivora]